MTAFEKIKAGLDDALVHARQMTAIEKAARAVEAVVKLEESDLYEVARAVLMAVLPTMDRWEVGTRYDPDLVEVSDEGEWVRYDDIQAILNEEPK
jgi:hypothetical protein